MRKIVFWIIAIITFSLFFVLYGKPLVKGVVDYVYYSPCDTPILYKIDSVDSRFNLTKEEFAKDVEEAISIWATVEQKQLFVADPKGKLSINLIFDNRQSLNDQITTLEDTLSTQKNAIDPQVAEYHRLSEEFKKKLDDLNTQITYWNSKGGAPSDEYKKLKEQQEALQQEATRLNALAKSLNQSTDLYNTEVGKLNQTVDTFKEALAQKPEEGVYDGKNQRIDIYFNIKKNELIHTLAHELGHALELKHVQNPKAIMYPFTTQEITPSVEETTALNYICRKRTIFETAKEVIMFYGRILQMRMKSNAYQ